ncbi:MAG: hypothetical protein CFH41_01936 [Alphaproteobacteria bacterium MarineAlpha11_Bin1]|nr:MAG: hypothetical protein CFH41_01936 [Alphaproteobacteria bacterium MarineAlpha11_Bin1]|tara:strand:+ start:4291 stop:5301 length:1011 start_codon:yes stop_codon:yes gene_type:complete
MKFCVFGAGAVGGFVGGMIARTNVEVSLIARGEHLSTIKANGLKVITSEEQFVIDVPATDTPRDLGVQDVIFLSAKAHSLTDAAKAIRPLLGPETTVISAQNGIPFWYFYAHGGVLEGHTLQTVDPNRRIADTIGTKRSIGCVITSSNTIEAPGVVRSIGNQIFSLGEPDGSISARLKQVANLLESAGLSAPTSGNIRGELWLKMWGNVSFSSMAVLTVSKLGPLAEDKDLQALGISIMREVRSVGEALGIEFNATIQERLESTKRIADHKTSILQDLEFGRPMEVDGITGAVVELGRLLGVQTPMIDLIYSLMRQRAREAGLYPETGVDPLEEGS